MKNGLRQASLMRMAQILGVLSLGSNRGNNEEAREKESN